MYRTGGGLIFRIADTPELGLKVEVLKGGAWVPGPIGMFGMRLDAATTKLNTTAVEKLPS